MRCWSDSALGGEGVDDDDDDELWWLLDGELGGLSGSPHCGASQSLLLVYQRQTRGQSERNGDGNISSSDNQHCNTERNETGRMQRYRE